LKKCPFCDEDVSNDSNYCHRCGRKLENFDKDNVVLEGEVVGQTYGSDTFIKEQTLLRDEYSRRAHNAFLLSIVSIFLCCCLLTSIASLVLSITLIFDMKKLSEDIKMTPEYQRVRNKAIISLIISGLLFAYAISSYISQLSNPVDYSSLLNEIEGAYISE